MNHLAVPFDATPTGQIASYRCVRCRTHWSADTSAPTTCQPRGPQQRTPITMENSTR